LPMTITCSVLCAQEPERPAKGLFHPGTIEGSPWRASIGFISIATPEDLTEEVRVRAPAGDLHVQRQLTDHLQLDGRLLFQVLQNQLSIGPRWVGRLGERSRYGAGLDAAFWAGRLGFAGFDSRATGSMLVPHLSIGHCFKGAVLLTVRGELLYTLRYTSRNGDLRAQNTANRFNGTAVTLALEQPFYHRKCLTLAVTALYADLYWATWALYDTLQRPVLYPMITVGFIL
jgi:hypothetical protein